MRHKLIKGSIWLPVFIVSCISLLADIAFGNIGVKNLPPASENKLLQFSVRNHIMGFKPGKVYLANSSGFLSVEFIGAHDVSPIGTAIDSNQAKDDPALTENSNNTLAKVQRVEYQTLWDGITLRYDAVKEGIAESTYFIQPEGNVADIKLKYNADTELHKDGSLKITLPTRQGYITESRPVAWQMLDGRKKEVQVAYEIKDGTIGFKTGAYNRDRELIIARPISGTPSMALQQTMRATASPLTETGMSMSPVTARAAGWGRTISLPNMRIMAAVTSWS